MNTLRALIDAWQDMDTATRGMRLAMCVALLVLFVAAGMGDGPR